MTPDDPLDRFFDRERSAIEPHPTSPEHWAAIVQEHRSARRRRPWAYLAGAAAAVIAIGAVALVVRAPDRDVARPGTSSTTPVPTPTTSPTSTAIVTVTTTQLGEPLTVTVTQTPPPAPVPVLKAFDVASVTNAGNGHLAALVTASCSGSRCTAVITSSDDGAHWTVASSVRGQVPGPDGPRILRLASPEIGWLVGTTVQRTTNGGEDWVEYTHPGQHVFGLETDGRDVVIVAGDAPTAEGTRQLIVSRAPIGAAEATAVGDPLDVTDLGAADVVWSRGQAYISTSGAGGPYRVDAEALTPLPMPQGHSSVGLVAASEAPTLYSVGARGAAAGSAAYDVWASSDGGRTWTRRTPEESPLTLANAGQTSFTATDAQHVVAVSGGSTELRGAMKVSTDGGRTWRAPAEAPPMPDRGWAWVGSPGNGIVYAIAVDPSGSHWLSTDDGRTWSRAVLNR